MNSPTSLAHSPKNDTRFDDLISLSEQLGERAGMGIDVQIQHLLAVTQSAFEAVIDNTKDKHGAGIDDATLIAEAYWKARNKSVIFDPRANNQRKTISCIRQCVTMGGWSKGGPGEPIGMINRAMTLYKNLRKVPGNTKRLVDAAGYLISLARKLKRSDYVLDDETLNELAFKKDPDIATIEDILDRTRGTLKKIYDGKHSAGACSTPNVEAAIKSLNKELKAIAESKRTVEQQDAIATAGQAISEAADKSFDEDVAPLPVRQ